MDESLSNEARVEEKASLENEKNDLMAKIEGGTGGDEDKARLEEVEKQLADLG